MLDLNKAEKLAKKWAREVGEIQKEKLAKINLEINKKSTNSDLVTEIDFLSEDILKENIKKEFSEHNILSEESDYENNNSKYTWVIDPLDGTNNYANSYPIYSVSIALKSEDDVILGIVYVPELDRMYSAVKDKGAYENKRRLKISQKKLLSDSIAATGFPYDKKEAKIDNLIPFNKILKKVRGIRRSGSAAFDIISVAKGSLDVFWEFKLSEWDYAAARLLITEAGGVFYETKIEDSSLIIAGNKFLVEEVKNILADIYT